MDDKTKTMMLTLATGVIKKGLLVAGTSLAGHGIINSNQTETFVSVGMVLVGLAWSFWNDYGRAIVLSQLEVLKAKSLAQAAKLNQAGIAPVTTGQIAAQSPTLTPAEVAKTVATLPPAVQATVAKILLAAFVLSFLVAGDPAQAQVKLKPLTGNIVNDIAAAKQSDETATPSSGAKLGDSGCKATGDAIADLHCVLKAGGAKLILHLKQSYALASAPGATAGTTTDNTSAMCTKALVPIVDLVVNGPKSGTIPAGDAMALTADEQTLASNAGEPDGAIVVIEKIRILRLAIQSPALNDACGALVQDEVKNAQSLVGKITSLITGAGLLAPLGL